MNTPPKLAILAGGGSLPTDLAATAVAAGRSVHILAIRGAADCRVDRFRHTWVSMGEVGKIMATIRREACSELLIVGSVRRPAAATLRLDLGGLLVLPTILRMSVGGDDKLLSRVVRFFEARGLTVVGAHHIAPGLLARKGAMGRHAPQSIDLHDVQAARDVVAALGAFDVGQCAVVSRGHVLAVEAAEGTDRMLERCGTLQQRRAGSRKARAGVLFKGPKPGQELRVDMPTIGVATVERAAAAGLAGIAIAECGVLIVDKAATITAADEAGLFLVGVSADGAEPRNLPPSDRTS